MKKTILILFVFAVAALPAVAQQLPDNHFESWPGKFKSDPQPADWHGSNVDQVVKFTLLFQKPGRTGYCAYVENRKVGAMGITELAPGYFSLGTPWQYIKGLNTKSATGGTTGGIEWKYRPDTMAVWIKRTGDNTDKEDFHLLYYAWSGTAKSSQYKGKAGGCTETERVNEQCDIRQALDGNACGTDQKARQIAEGWIHKRAKYNEWTLVKVPIYYFNSARPTMCNVIFAGGNYPAGGSSDGQYEGNGLYVDDVEMIYSSRIDKLTINGKEWKEFNPNSSDVQICKLSALAPQTETAAQPAEIKIEGFRGIGTLTNTQGKKAHFGGRKLDGTEMTVTAGALKGNPWVITVKAEDGSSTHTYKIKIE